MDHAIVWLTSHLVIAKLVIGRLFGDSQSGDGQFELAIDKS